MCSPYSWTLSRDLSSYQNCYASTIDLPPQTLNSFNCYFTTSPIISPASTNAANFLTSSPSTVYFAQPILKTSYDYNIYEQSNNSKVNEATFCDVCKVNCTTKSSVISHFTSDKHKRKALKLTSENANSKWKCEICSVECTSDSSYKSHLMSLRHAKRMIDSKNILQSSQVESSEPNCSIELVGEDQIESIITDRGIKYKCKLCDCNIQDDSSRILHLAGRKHRLLFKKRFDSNIIVEPSPRKKLKNSQYQAQKRSEKIETNEAIAYFNEKVYF